MAIDFSHVTCCLCVRLKAFSYRIIALFRLAVLAEFQYRGVGVAYLPW